MTTPNPHSRRHRFSLASLRILDEAAQDSGCPLLSTRTDLQMLLSFLDRFDGLGWIPPVTEEKRRALADFGVIIHVVDADILFYEFCSKGARGERQPWLTLFFHVSSASKRVRICGVEKTQLLERRRKLILQNMSIRVQRLDERLRKYGKES